MKRFFALLICVILCTQSVALAAPPDNILLYEEDTGQSQEQDSDAGAE